MIGVYYNEWDPFAAAWLRELIKEGLIPNGEVDTRSILDVSPGDLRGFRQCHFFAGIGGWALAFAEGGIAPEDEAWSGSCPCQPLSIAGQGLGHADQRHVWPAFYNLIAECRPSIVFGEQVASPLGREWLAGIRADLEVAGYAVGAANLPACSVGAPHIRYRNFWIAHADGGQPRDRRLQSCGEHGFESQDGISCGVVGDTSVPGLPGSERQEFRGPGWTQEGRAAGKPSGPSGSGERLGDAQGRRRRIFGNETFPGRGGHFDRTVTIRCADGKYRRVAADETGQPEPILFPLAYGVPNRMGSLRGAGNAINTKIAGKFIAAGLASIADHHP